MRIHSLFQIDQCHFVTDQASYSYGQARQSGGEVRWSRTPHVLKRGVRISQDPPNFESITKKTEAPFLKDFQK